MIEKNGKVHTLTMYDWVINAIIEGASGADFKQKLFATPESQFLIDIVYSSEHKSMVNTDVI